MIFDGQWKRELKTLSREIAFWRKMSFVSGYAEHRLNRAVLYSATVLRKVIKDEVEAESIAKKTNISLQSRKLSMPH